VTFQQEAGLLRISGAVQFSREVVEIEFGCAPGAYLDRVAAAETEGGI
jgi:hypothetical protein